MAKFTKSKCYRGCKEIRSALTDAFNKFKTSNDSAALVEDLKLVQDKLIKLIEEAAQ